MIEFNLFLTPHMVESAATFLYDVIDECGIGQRLSNVGTDRAMDMVKQIEWLWKSLAGGAPGMFLVSLIQTVCISYMINLAIKECMSLSLIHEKVMKIRKLLNLI